MKRLLFIVICALFPMCRFKTSLLKALKFDVASGALIGNSLVLTTQIFLGEKSRIGSFNLIGKNVKVDLKHSARIGSLNIIVGDFLFKMNEGSMLSNSCSVKNAGEGVIPESSIFEVGRGSKITSKHYFDLSCSIFIGCNCVVGGRESQFWTHGFLHENAGKRRFISFRSINVADGVYIGSAVIVNPGTNIGIDANILSGSVLAGDIQPSCVLGTSSKKIVYDLSENSIENIYEIDLHYKCNNPRLLTKKMKK